MSLRTLRRASIPLALLLLYIPSASALGTQGRVDWATTWLADKQEPAGSFPSSFATTPASTADAILSLVASGQGGEEIDDAVEWLLANADSVDTVGQKAKVVMALVAAGHDPRSFGSHNFVDEIVNTFSGEVYESVTESQVYDQALVILALVAADEPVERAAVRWLAGAQCPNGGWQFDQPHGDNENQRCLDTENTDFNEADTNTTGLVMQALAAAPYSPLVKENPFTWLRARQDPVKDGWGFNKQFSLTDSASTGIVLQTFAAYDKKPPKGARAALRALQRYCKGANSGGFALGWIEEDGKFKRTPGQDIGNTVIAILGLLEEPLPIEPQPFLEPMPEALPCDPVN